MDDMTPEEEFRFEMVLNLLNSKSLRLKNKDFDYRDTKEVLNQILINQENIMLMLLHKLGGIDLEKILAKRNEVETED